jgi:synaptojanin
LGDRRWFVRLIQGSIRNFKVTLEGGSVLDYTLITRRSWAKGGTRYNSRGIDTHGNVANFCETEEIILIGKECFSHIQIRGSVPCFWKQTGLYG